MINVIRNQLKLHILRISVILLAVVLMVGCGPAARETTPTTASTVEAPTLTLGLPTETVSPTESVNPTNSAISTESAGPAEAEPTRTTTNEEVPEPIGIILFIGDGMGGAHRQAAAWMGYGRDGQLAMDGLQVRGSLSTTAVGNMITDSAAAATAMASGVRTRNGLVGLNPEGERVKTVLDRAQQLGMAVGLVTNTQLTHATPAAFAAHSENRWDMAGIAPQLLETEVDVLLGGGENYFLPAGSQGCHTEPGKREDDRNLIHEARETGYLTICQPDELNAFKPGDADRLLGVFADEGMPRPFSPSLAEMTEAALDVLAQNPTGFFLVVESGQIDWASHGNAAYNAIQVTLALDEAVQAALEYTDDHPNTLLIVTADHETGGMSVHSQPTGTSGEVGPFSGPENFVFYVTWSTDTHTNVDVPVTAQGPGADLLEGEHENTRVFKAVLSGLTGAGFPEGQSDR